MFKKLFKALKKALRFKKRRSKKRKKTLRRRTSHHRRAKPRRIAKRRRRLTKRRPVRKHKRPQPQLIGSVTHYFPKVNAAVVKLKKPLVLGEPVWVKGKITDFRQTVGSMQIDRKPIEKARPGQEIGLEVFREVRQGDAVYRSGK